MPLSTSYVLIILLTVVALLAVVYALYIKFKAKSYTRERYAFAALGATVSLTTLGITIMTASTPWKAAAKVVAALLGKPIGSEPSSLSEKLMLGILIGFAIHQIFRVFNNWDGQTSLKQYQKGKFHERSSLIGEGLEEFSRIVRRRPPVGVYASADHRTQGTALDPPVDKLAWRDQARDLIVLRWSSYSFDPIQGWHERASCWIGKNARTNATAGLLCTRMEPSYQNLSDFVGYVQGFRGSNSEAIDLFVAIQQGKEKNEMMVGGVKVYLETEQSLLENLVEFTDYFIEIKKRVEVENLPDSDLTISNVYVPSRIQIEKDNDTWEDIPEDLDEYLYSWTREPGQRQLALLGEYGQGKSTGALLYTYQLIKQSNEQPERVPILIELRGKSPSTLEPVEFFGAWASSYRIEPQALMKLLVAGRLLLIFEGFDEMADVGDAEARRNHFRALWRYCYPKAKILITGRPNLFLDDHELKTSLGIEKSTATGPYCQALKLRPFKSRQISESLRWATTEVRQQIVQLAEQDENFRGIVSRPSLLYIVAHLWNSPELVTRRTNMNSALVIGLFIQHSYKRQTEKHRDSRRFMVLTEIERSYFLDGIAAYMAANGLQNQVTREQFDIAIANLYRVIPKPEELSAQASVLSEAQESSPHEDGAQPLAVRLRDREDPLEAVKTDVRTYGILVQDFSRTGALRFAHKSFFEYLFANYVAQRLTGRDKVISSAILAATEATPEKIIDMPESLSFAGELIGQSNNTSVNLSKKSEILKNLFNTIVIGESSRMLRYFNYSIFIFRTLKQNPNVFIRMLPMALTVFLPASFIWWTILFPVFSKINYRFTLINSIENLNIVILVFAVSTACFSLYICMEMLPRSHLIERRIVLWFMISVSLGIRQKDMQSIYGNFITKGLPRLVRRYGAEDILAKFQYEVSS